MLQTKNFNFGLKERVIPPLTVPEQESILGSLVSTVPNEPEPITLWSAL
jgi:hypothetical protein